MSFDVKKSKRRGLAMAAVSALAMAFAPLGVNGGAAFAQNNDEDRDSGRETRRAETLSTSVATRLQKIFEDMQAENWTVALTALNDVYQRSQNAKPFDRATILQLRGSVKANLEDYNGAIRDFEQAVALGALPPAAERSLKFNIGQLYMATEQWQKAIGFIKPWVDGEENPGSDAYYLLATAYAQTDRFREALPYGERAIETSPEPKRDRHDLLNYIYLETNNRTKRIALLRKMVGFWPDRKDYWTQLAGSLAESGNENEAFSVLELAYQAGRLDKCSEIRTLAQLYYNVSNSYRGAKMFESEIAAGNCESSKQNNELLSQLWRDAREHQRAIPPLTAAARASDDGELFLRLGQTYYADEKWSESERALVSALNKGGLKSRDRGTTWLLLGNARYNQGDRDGALKAFQSARSFDNVARDANGWIDYIRAEIDFERQQDALEQAQKEEEERRERERLEAEESQRRLLGDGFEDNGSEG
ncbi:MAG: tetratricopeptide repeat protein [Pseudomonadota bacterium]